MANTAIIKSTDGLKEYILMKLGQPAHHVEISDEQLMICIEEALDLFNDYHYDSHLFQFIAQEITQEDLDNGFFTPPDEVYEVINAVNVASGASKLNFAGNPNGFGLPASYQSYSNGGWVAGGFGRLDSSSGGPGSSSYYLMRTKLADMNMAMNPGIPIRYYRHDRKLFIENKNNLKVGGYIVYYAKILSDEVWNNSWLKRYCTELARKQWAINLMKFVNYKLPGDIEFNSSAILDLAEQELEKLKEELHTSYSAQPGIFIL